MPVSIRIFLVAAATVGWTLVGAAPAVAYSLTPGMVIDDINFSLNQSASYDGSTQTLTVSVGADRIDLQGGGTIELDPGDLTLEMAVQLLAPVSGFPPVFLGDYASIASYDILLKDSVGTLFQAEFTGGSGGQIQITDFGFGSALGNLGGGFLADPLSNPLMTAIATLDGNLVLSLDNIFYDDSDFNFAIDDGAGGFNSFTAGVTGDLSFAQGSVPNPEFVPVPEPATGLLLAFALAALAMAGRRRS